MFDNSVSNIHKLLTTYYGEKQKGKKEKKEKKIEMILKMKFVVKKK